jgi:hypothetical protein
MKNVQVLLTCGDWASVSVEKGVINNSVRCILHNAFSSVLQVIKHQWHTWCVPCDRHAWYGQDEGAAKQFLRRHEHMDIQISYDTVTWDGKGVNLRVPGDKIKRLPPRGYDIPPKVDIDPPF